MVKGETVVEETSVIKRKQNLNRNKKKNALRASQESPRLYTLQNHRGKCATHSFEKGVPWVPP